MSAIARRRSRHEMNIWPGFVDALATLVMVVVFVLMVFTVFQFHLRDLISGRDEALARLSRQIGELSSMLNLERRAGAELRNSIAQLSAELQGSTTLRDRLTQELAAANAQAQSAQSLAAKAARDLEDANKTVAADREKIEVQLRDLDALRRNVDILTSLRREIEAKLAEQTTEGDRARQALAAERQQTQTVQQALAAAQQALAQERLQGQTGQQALAAERRVSQEAQAQTELLNRQLASLRDQLARLNAALVASEAKATERETQIVNLGQRLNTALAGRVEELARFRSEFFGRLRQTLGDRADIRVVGDRFVLQSELLFTSGSAELDPDGRLRLETLARGLAEIAGRMPSDLNWVLQIDGHTDKRPIATAQFPSNWELSTARATSVVKFLATRGIPNDRLSAAGFGEFQPIDGREDEIGFRRNRRIEIKITSR